MTRGGRYMRQHDRPRDEFQKLQRKQGVQQRFRWGGQIWSIQSWQHRNCHVVDVETNIKTRHVLYDLWQRLTIFLTIIMKSNRNRKFRDGNIFKKSFRVSVFGWDCLWGCCLECVESVTYGTRDWLLVLSKCIRREDGNTALLFLSESIALNISIAARDPDTSVRRKNGGSQLSEWCCVCAGSLLCLLLFFLDLSESCDQRSERRGEPLLRLG